MLVHLLLIFLCFENDFTYRRPDMLKKITFLFLAIFVSTVSAKADESIYNIVEQEDLDAFSDMVVLGYSVDEIGPDGNTPLILAATLGKRHFAQFLILNEVDINKRGKDGTVALHHAAHGGYTDIIELLCKEGGFIDFPDYQGYTPLMYAVLGNKIDAVKKLLELGANVNYINIKNETALSIARRKKMFSIISLLKQYDAH